jgi:hypothetical protein
MTPLTGFVFMALIYYKQFAPTEPLRKELKH